MTSLSPLYSSPFARRAEIPLGLWLGLPLIFAVGPVPIMWAHPTLYPSLFEGETGLVELATFAVLIPGIISGWFAWSQRRRLPRSWLRFWITLVTGGCVYFAGAEIGWGQGVFGWPSPETILGLGAQQTTDWGAHLKPLDGKPRLLFGLWALMTVLLHTYRFLLGRPRYLPDDWRGWFWPSAACVPSAVLATAAYVPQLLPEFPSTPLLQVHYGEWQELFLAMMLSFYLMSIRTRLSRLGW